MTDNAAGDTRAVLGILRAQDHLFGVPTDALAELARIEKLEPFLSDRPEVLGAITLRGIVIPVLDPVALCGLAPRQVPPSIAAVIWGGDYVLALGIDQIEELHRCDLSQLQHIDRQVTHEVVQGHLVTQAGTANVLDVAALFQSAQMPRARRIGREQGKTTQRAALPHLTFRSGGISYAIDIRDVSNTAPGGDFDHTDIASGAFLGTITNLKRRIPVVDVNGILNMRAPRENASPEIVVLQIDETRLIGLAVDRILSISHLEADSLPMLPEYLRASAPLIKATLTAANKGENVLVLDAQALMASPVIRELSDMSRVEKPANAVARSAEQEGQDESGNVVHERSRSVVFIAGRELATPVECVVSVLDPPRELIPWAAPVLGLTGLFSFEGQMLPLVDLATHLGEAPSGDDRLARVLIAGPPDKRVGFLVEGVVSISISKLRVPLKGVHADMAQIQEWPKDRMIGHIRLSDMSQAVSDQFAR